MRQRKARAKHLSLGNGRAALVLTDDFAGKSSRCPGCHLDSMRQRKNAYYFQDGNALVDGPGGTKVRRHPHI